MLSKNTLFLFVFILLISCQQKEQPLTVEEAAWINILVDIHLAEASIQNAVPNQKDSISDLYYEQVFKIHKIEKKDFMDNLLIMEKNPKMINEIYSKVMEELSKREATYK